MDIRFENRTTWRDYQNRLNRKRESRHSLSRMMQLACALGMLVALVLGIRYEIGRKAPDQPAVKSEPPEAAAKPSAPVAFANVIGKQDIRAWLPPGAVINLEKKSFDIQVNRGHYRVDTTLDLDLQTHLLKKVRGSNAHHMGLVAMDPDTGRVLAMVGLDGDNIASNPCLDNSFPAASVFKIVTASAAIEACGFNAGTPISFNGGKYTLYKSQIKSKTGRYSTTLSFRDSFAQSVNPVFGRIGANQLGKAPLEKYGAAFGFNRDINFEAAFPASALGVTEDSYHLAEIASGFNRVTTLSPLHGAMIVSAVLNRGRLPEPTMIDQVVDESGHKLYEGKEAVMGEPISSRTSDLLTGMMTETVLTGTGRRAFRGFQKDRVLSRLTIGGKTGSMDNKTHDRRIDWFVGFAKDKDGKKKIVVAVVVAHAKYIGMRASEFARFTFEDYFKEYFAKADAIKK